MGEYIGTNTPIWLYVKTRIIEMIAATLRVSTLSYCVSGVQWLVTTYPSLRTTYSPGSSITGNKTLLLTRRSNTYSFLPDAVG